MALHVGPVHWPTVNVIACVSFCAVDVTVYHDGYHGDLNETVFVGKVDEAGRNLVQVAYECLMKGIDIGRLCGWDCWWCGDSV